jgi:hypothetical protein
MKTRLTILIAALLLPLCNAPASDFLNEAVLATPVLVKAGSGSLLGWGMTNLSNAPAYAHFYDAATAGAVTVGTTVQVFMVPVPQTGAFYLSPGVPPHDFTLGIVVAFTTSPLYTGTTAPNVGIFTQLQYR